MPVPQREEGDGQSLTDLDGVHLPSLAAEHVDAARLDHVFPGFAILAGPRYKQVDVGIGPLYFFDRSRELDWLLFVKFGCKRMMCYRRNSGGQQARDYCAYSQ